MKVLGAAPRIGAGAFAAILLFLVYVATLAPDVTFWDAGEFIAAAHALGIPHPPGTPLYVLLVNTWTKLVPVGSAIAANLLSAVATALAAGITAKLVHRATANGVMAFAAAVAAGGMSSVWLNATESEVYAVALALGVLTIWAGDRAGRGGESDRRCLFVTAYLIALAVPLHLSALVAAPAAIVLAARTANGVQWWRMGMLSGVLVMAMGVGRMSIWVASLGAVMVVISGLMSRASQVSTRPVSPVSTSDDSRVTHADTSHGTHADASRFTHALAVLGLSAIALSALAFLYVRARFDPAINQGDSDTLKGFVDMVARRQYDVSPMWPRKAPVWAQFGNLGQYADWQVALSLGPTVYPSVPRSMFTAAFLGLGYIGAVEHWRLDRRTWLAMIVLFVCGSLGVLVYLNLHAGPSIGYGILPEGVVREARERDYFYVFAFWAWGIWAGIGAVALAGQYRLAPWAGALVALLPIALNWRAVTRRGEPEQSLPRTFAQSTLESTPRNGVLLVMGDNDSYPLWYAQQVLRVRTDVAVVTVPLLPTDWYREQIARRFKLLDSTSARRYDGKLETAARIAAGARAARRPIAASMLVTRAERERIGRNWVASGMVYVEAGTLETATREPGMESVDTLTSARIAAWIDTRLSRREVRPAIDPVNQYFRRMLECPRLLMETTRNGDSARLDSICNYR